MNKFYYLLFFVLTTAGIHAQPTLVKDIYPGSESGNPIGLTKYNGKVYFNGTNPDSSGNAQMELWVTDGTESGTHIVYDMPDAGGGAINPYAFKTVGSKMFFIGDVAGGTQLWSTDGTEAGTKVVVTASYPDVFFGTDNNLVSMGNNVFVRSIETGSMSCGFYKTDGTVPGTKRLAATNATAGTFTRASVLNSNLILFLGLTHEFGITKTDGTPAGTSEIKQFKSDIYSNMVTLNNAVLFIGDTSALGNAELWKTDGTSAGTVKVKEINPGNAPTSSIIQTMTVANGFAYFWADDGIHGMELWKSDGTTAGTTMVKDLTVGSGGSNNLGLILTLNNNVVFTNSDASGLRYDLWVSDGTESGTFIIMDSLTTPIGPISKTYDFVGNEMIFADGENIYVTNGTLSGTKLVTSCSIANGPMMINELVCNNNMILMNIFDTTYYNELYRFDYTPDTTSSGLSKTAQHSTFCSIYPNPFSNELTVETTSGIELNSIRITDIYGKIIINQSVTSNHHKISISDLPKGVYFYLVTDKNGQSNSGKLIRE